MQSRQLTLAALLVVTGAVAACSGASAPSATPPASQPSPSTAPSSASPSPAPVPSATARPTAVPTPTPVPAAYRLVGLGDSIAGAGHCGAGCRSYVLVLGELAASALGDSVDTVNLASNNDLGSGGLRSLVESDVAVRDALAAANVVTIGIGWNDWQGPCFWAGLQACLENNQAKVEENLDATLGEIGRIRDGKPTAIRVVTYANPFPGDPQTTSYFNLPADVPIEDLQAMLSKGLASFNAMLCKVAERQEGACVDLVPVFNGSTGDQPIEDALRGSQAQMDLIAKTIDAAGYSPLP